MKKQFLFALLGSAMLFASYSAVSAQETEAATEAAAEAADQVLSDDIYSFQMLFDDVLYEFPMTYADFTANGWTCQDDESSELAPNMYTWCTFKKGELRVTVDVLNLCQNTLPVSSCDVVGFSAEEYDMKKEPDASMVLPGGITFGVSTADDITAAYGPASDTYEGSLYTKLTYEYSVYQSVEISVDLESGVISKIDIQNMDDAKCATAGMEVEISDEVPANVQNYAAPEAVSDNLYDYTVEYAGDLIKLPCPVSVFLENGWTKTSNSEDTVAGKDSGWIYLMKDNQEFHTLAKNYEPNATVIENCFVTEIKTSEFGPDLTMVLPRGLGRGMTAAELEAALDGISYETSESGSFRYYNIAGEDSSLDGYQFCLNIDEDKVTTVEMEYRPRSLD